MGWNPNSLCGTQNFKTANTIESDFATSVDALNWTGFSLDLKKFKVIPEILLIFRLLEFFFL